MPSTKRQIKILGSGPAGMAAAINLAKNGFNVVVYEQRERPGAHFCSGWQILENYSSDNDALKELESMNINPEFFYKPESNIDFFDSRLRRFPLRGKKPFGYFLKRGTDTDTLDTALYNQAQNAGVEFHFRTRINAQKADIIAGGSVHAAGITKEVVFESDTKDILMTILDNYLTPLGFSYMFIINGHGTIGTAVLRDFKHINGFAESVVLRFQQLLNFDMRRVRESVSPVGFFIPKTAVVNNKLYAGEAAGFQDYLFGLGIRRSIQSGYLAAKSLIDGIHYDILWRKKFGALLTGSILNRFIYEKCGNTGYTILLRFAQHLDFQKTGFFLQNPSFFRNISANVVKLLWKSSRNCKHKNRCAWCRSH